MYPFQVPYPAAVLVQLPLAEILWVITDGLEEESPVFLYVGLPGHDSAGLLGIAARILVRRLRIMPDSTEAVSG